MKNYESRITKIFCLLGFFAILIVSANAQSINQSSPTPITANEISGRIPARDLGDARLTTYFYTFDGKQGDVFINVVTTNFNGDIDVFTADNLRPLTKITVYADSPNSETGRVVYLRQPVKLILRIEGRTPNDDAATFQMKFAGSFAPSTAIAETTDAPEVKSNNETDVRVNSVGTIIEIKPKPTPTPKEVIAKVERKPKEKKPKTVAENKPKTEKSPTETIVEKPDVNKNVTKEIVAETDAKENPMPETKPKNEPETEPEKAKEPKPPILTTPEETAEKDKETAKTETPPAKESEKTPTVESDKSNAEKSIVKESKTKKKSAVQPIPPSALTSINLIILFKDGSKIERPMSEVLKVGVDKGILTIISKDGAIGRYSILDVEKMTIQ